MGQEMRKAMHRRLHEPTFAQRIFVGDVLDVGAGDDGFARYRFLWPRVTNVREWQHDDGDGTDLPGLPDASFDCVVSSHSLEHMRDPLTALRRWLAVTKVGGHVVFVVPDFAMYEHHCWPSANNEHTHAFLIDGFGRDHLPEHVNLVELVMQLDGCETVKIERLESTFDFGEDRMLDQTCFGHGSAESAIEVILRRIA